ncbi:unnamed protein product [Meganyctiphanes norvegica]|uniref:PH domain-containing protein n=1 Tax=Meganyctiphanes norvegica TaxID=48144 RepID=A0AAV2PPP9_MEGNR
MYHEGPMDAYPRGEIFLGHKDDQGDGPKYNIKEGVPKNCKDHEFSFSIITPDRTYVLSAPTKDLRQQWMEAINKVLERPLRPQDNHMAVNLIRKRPGKFSLDIFSLG